jgi:hypothetical protein
MFGAIIVFVIWVNIIAFAIVVWFAPFFLCFYLSDKGQGLLARHAPIGGPVATEPNPCPVSFRVRTASTTAASKWIPDIRVPG